MDDAQRPQVIRTLGEMSSVGRRGRSGDHQCEGLSELTHLDAEMMNLSARYPEVRSRLVASARATGLDRG
ncbi:hypothetical protein [Rhodococcus opacus]|uniref:hypothetical protein n=1 Tax=Rhodococcus opacus TaxID=37919 RepID=UPI002476F616|nr:hypothetical protein [Rhodococcus opacus]MDH6293272.1 hypothetical protein [Rhodococcus opacus]